MNNISFKLKNIDVGYSHILVRNVNLSASGSDVIGIIGYNGSGKSTLLKTIAGILRPISGDIIFNNKIISGSKSRLVSAGFKVGFVQQDNRIFGSLTVEEHLHLAQWHNKSRETRENNIYNLLKDPIFCNMKDFLHTNASHLSGGYNLLLSLMMVILQEANVILLDEPSSNLDESKNKMLIDIIKTFSYSGKIVLIIEQNLKTVFSCSNKVYRIVRNEKHNLLTGISEDILRNIRNTFTDNIILTSSDIRKLNSLLWN